MIRMTEQFKNVLYQRARALRAYLQIDLGLEERQAGTVVSV